MAAGHGTQARDLINTAKDLWTGHTTDAGARQQCHLALGKLFLGEAYSYMWFENTTTAHAQVSCCVAYGTDIAHCVTLTAYS
jgi:hypothetical protein